LASPISTLCIRDKNRELATENRRLFHQLNNSKFDLEQHQLLCEKLVTEALRAEDRLQGTIDSLKNKLSHTTSLTFSEVCSPIPAIQTPDRCYKGNIQYFPFSVVIGKRLHFDTRFLSVCQEQVVFSKSPLKTGHCINLIKTLVAFFRPIK
jgi:hypothetical protein